MASNVLFLLMTGVEIFVGITHALHVRGFTFGGGLMMPGLLSFSVPAGISHVGQGNQGGGVRLL